MFRPCIDLHEGKVKQIVGGTLDSGGLRTNFVSDQSAAWFAELYRRDGLTGGHVIMLGPGNEAEARAALAAFPGGLQIGGGVSADNARGWLDAGASHVIVTSWVFRDGGVDEERLAQLVKLIGKERLVIDLSCRKRAQPTSSPRDEGVGRGPRRGETIQDAPPLPGPLLHPIEEREKTADAEYFVVTDRWQKFTDVTLSAETLQKFSASCAEFLVHAVDVEGLCRGIDGELVKKLGEWSPIPVTYAGGANSLADLETVTKLGQGKVDLTIGSALDIFGGRGVKFAEAVAFNRRAKV
ncbi:MAG: phosphoribosylformimino-5-aminoimidazole carboxamide ribotide isomerase [Pedosphaera sp.]|nr:phosphoribosylformimino-5-aminoimidazole carboxamide ribotide isomerase [Pedosphaera sp.]